jgi:cytochrome bd-type quinol oxidase subunit 1
VFISIIPTANYFIEMKDTNITGYIIIVVLSSIFYVALITIMALSCGLAINECSRSPVIVQNIMRRDDIDSEVMKELEMMFTQFKVMKIGFSACEMYRIDLPFLCSIIGSIFSYVIVFSQL